MPVTNNWKTYLESKPELISAGITTEEAAIRHYLENDILEYRDFFLPKDFDWKTYLTINTDLKDAGITTERGAIHHYLMYGIAERRNLRSHNFNWKIYLLKYLDLHHAGITTEESAHHHYLTYGIAEGRNCELWGPTIYLIGGVDGGGSLKFTKEFMQYIPNTVQITKKIVFNKTAFKMNDILIVQHLFADITPEMICDVKARIKCRIMINIHDFWWFDIHKPHNSYVEPVSIKDNIRQLFKAAELVIHPSQFTFTEYSKYFPSNNFIISPHIDYTDISSEIAIPKIVKSTIRIGCMHLFSDCKGSEYVTYLQRTFNTYKGFKIDYVIVGVNTPLYNENEYFDVIKKLGLHCLFLLNKWGETYCYSLSKFLKSGLPILYNAIGAAAERIPDIPAYKSVFNSVVAFNEADKMLLNNKFTEMINFIIAAEKKPSKAFIDTSISVPPLYDFMFKSYVSAPSYNKISNHLVETIFVLSSTIIVSSMPLCYTPTRSFFSGEQRLQQTIKCIKTIRSKIPNVAIFLVDPSPVPIEWRIYLESIVDKYIDCSDNEDVCSSTSSSLNKGVAECKQILASLDYISEYPNATSVCKITGRYALTHSFDMKYFSQQKIYFKLIPKGSIFFEPTAGCYTFFYKVPICYLAHLRDALLKTILIGTETLESIETILPFQFDPSIVSYDAHLGISGWVGPSGCYFDNII